MLLPAADQEAAADFCRQTSKSPGQGAGSRGTLPLGKGEPLSPKASSKPNCTHKFNFLTGNFHFLMVIVTIVKNLQTIYSTQIPVEINISPCRF